MNASRDPGHARPRLSDDRGQIDAVALQPRPHGTGSRVDRRPRPAFRTPPVMRGPHVRKQQSTIRQPCAATDRNHVKAPRSQPVETDVAILAGRGRVPGDRDVGPQRRQDDRTPTAGGARDVHADAADNPEPLPFTYLAREARRARELGVLRQRRAIGPRSPATASTEIGHSVSPCDLAATVTRDAPARKTRSVESRRRPTARSPAPRVTATSATSDASTAKPGAAAVSIRSAFTSRPIAPSTTP